MHRDIGRRTGTAMTQLLVGAELSSRGRPPSVADRKMEMCSISDVRQDVFANVCVGKE